ncbi:DUF1259 domain-containing protein [Streptomyces yaanensis]|uniref:DUF1259 domain-containing protein n=1 Tax=Streptomyces yaanensis TaxID=1142239 RepID=A0ABV7S5K1_9ACTN|nr:DUF1259 domain-containing protein [Streptomyces sp. CGMCC 4.7035]WNB99913.1 DUF1259 domain-containing protein [Streptomyces sp. CGMCC 4.7035]
MTTEDRQQDTHPRGGAPRRRMLAAAALAPMLAGAPAPALALSTEATKGRSRAPVEPVRTALSDWTGVADALGRTGDMKRNVMYHTGLPRRDLVVLSHGVIVEPALALGSHVSFVRYADGGSLLMGDVVVTERELQPFSDVLHEHGIELTAIHKHLLSQFPDVWWIHVHAHGHDPVAIARGLRAAFDRTGTPPPAPPAAQRPIGLDTAGIDAAMGVKGMIDDGIYKSTFVRRETVTDGDLRLPPGLGSTTAINFQPLGGGRAAVNGDCVMIAGEVQNVLAALRRAGAELVELHHHGLRDEPRLFFVHFWAVGDAVRLARGLRAAVDATNVAPVAGTATLE